MHCDEDSQHDDPFPKYIWWFDTYPMEFAEFLLTTALARGIWLHPLAANDVGYMDNVSIGEDLKQSGTLANDTKTSRAGRQNPGDREVFLTTASNDFLIYNGCQCMALHYTTNEHLEIVVNYRKTFLSPMMGCWRFSYSTRILGHFAANFLLSPAPIQAYTRGGEQKMQGIGS